MPQTRRHQRFINALDQNASQSIYRLSPELIGEIFLLARPEILPKEEGLPWDKLVRYLVGITSITGHFRRIALDFGELWSVVGFSLGEKNDARYRVVLVMLGAFLERARGCTLHFWIADDLGYSRPVWFYSRLVTLIRPHIGRAQTFYFLQYDRGHKFWEELCVLVNDAVNLNKLTLQISTYFMIPSPPLRVTNTLPKLRELRLAGLLYDASLQETMKQVEILELNLRSREIVDLHQWLGGSIKLKRLVLPGNAYDMPQLIEPKSPVRLGDLTYLCINFQLYQSIASWISLPNLRHLDVYMSPRGPSTLSHFEAKGYHYPPLRTLRMVLSPLHAYARDEAALIIMNPQLEYLEMDWSWYESCLEWVLSESSNQRFMLPSGVLPTFPGLCLKYLRMTVHDRDHIDLAPSPKFLSSILSKDSQLKLDLYCPRRPVTFKRLMEQFPSQVKYYDEHHDRIPLDELYERAQRES